ncbi:MAG: prepilin peptidase [Patescibacteria group bacterium]|nr:prepilin peptidase [Patescibacteria group bacterium]
MVSIILFVLGLSFGSFINVIALRYNPDRFLFSRTALGGRSRCAHCKKTLRWFELVPLISFLFQRGRCRSCHTRLSPQYMFAEIIAGAIFVLVPIRIASLYLLPPTSYYLLVTVWIFVLLILLLLSLIDVRFRIIPDECNVALIGAGMAIAILTPVMNGTGGSFLGAYGILLLAQSHIWVNKLLGFLAGAFGLGILAVATRGKGMGMGDIKLAAALGVVFGWPDIAVLLGIAFVLGAIAGILEIATAKNTLNGTLPFGPFIALGATMLFFGGSELVKWYFGVFAGWW